MSTELRNRLLLGPVLAAVPLILMGWDINSGERYGSLIIALLVVFFGSIEFGKLCAPFAAGIQRSSILIGGTLLCLAQLPQIACDVPHISSLIIGLAFAVICFRQMKQHGLEQFLPNVAMSTFGLIYIGLTIQLLFLLALIETEANALLGVQLLICTVVSCKFGDIFAFFGGRTFGKHKLCPKISPGKTWEGFIASFIGAVAGAFLCNWLTGLAGVQPFSAWWQIVVFGIVLGPVGAAGDLVESCIKRSVEAKDSGNTLPGFGGFLDIFDAVFLAAPVAYLFGYLLSLYSASLSAA